MVYFKIFDLLCILLKSFVVLLIIGAVVLFLHRASYGITYQGSRSMPRGFYFVRPATKIYRGEIVIFHPPKAIQPFLKQHPWTPMSGVLMKKIVGMPGDRVCIKHGVVWLNGRKIAPILKYYARGCLLPHWSFCGKLPDKQYLLMSLRIVRSFDSRYFGPVGKGDIVGEAVQII